MDSLAKRGESARAKLIHLPKWLAKDKKAEGEGKSKSFLFGGKLGKLGLGVGIVASSSILAKSFFDNDDGALEAMGDAVPDESTEPSQTAAKVPTTTGTSEASEAAADTAEPIPVPEADVKQESIFDKVGKLFRKEPEPTPVDESIKTGTYTSQLSEKLAKNTRGEVQFSGFSNAEGLTKNGRYTPQEADKIRALKASGADTSANAGKMSKGIEDRIRFYSRKHGVDENNMLQMAQMESGGNPNAISSTGAIGVFQFTGRTATDMGITDRFDPDQNIEAGVLLAKKSLAKLSGRTQADPVAVYLMHQLGAKGGAEVMAAAETGRNISDLSAGTQKAISFNYGGKKAKTAAEYVNLTRAALASRSTSDKFASGANVIGQPATETLASSTTIPNKVSASAPSIPVAALGRAESNTVPAPIVIPKSNEASVPQSVRTAALERGHTSTQAPLPPREDAKPQSIFKTKSGLLVAA